jgi:hypothetical protein
MPASATTACAIVLAHTGHGAGGSFAGLANAWRAASSASEATPRGRAAATREADAVLSQMPRQAPHDATTSGPPLATLPIAHGDRLALHLAPTGDEEEGRSIGVCVDETSLRARVSPRSA